MILLRLDDQPDAFPMLAATQFGYGPRYWRETRQGDFVPARSLPLADRGFRYGMAVFETLRIYAGRPLFVTEHLQRLEEACRKFEFPVVASRFAAATAFLVSATGMGRALPPAAHGVARIHVTAGDGSVSDPPGPCRIFLSWEPRRPIDDEARRLGLRLHLHPHPYHPTMGGMKTHNYWSNLGALALAHQQGADEALLCDAKRRLISTCLGNVFLVAGGELITPPLGSGVRQGVVREWVINHFGARQQEIAIRDETALKGCGLVVTNSWFGAVQGHCMFESFANVENLNLINTVVNTYKERVERLLYH